MRLSEIERQAPNSVGIIFGRFNPPHKGHLAAWEMMQDNHGDNWYVGTNENTNDKKNPLPYDIKIKAMEVIYNSSPKAKPGFEDRLIATQSWLTMATLIYELYPGADLKVYTDEEWVIKAINQYNGVEGKAHGFYQFNNIENVATPRVSSATALRTAVLEKDRDAFAKAAGVDADELVDGVHYFELVDEYLSKYYKS